MGYEVKLPGKQTLKARIVGIYGSSINGGAAIYDNIKLQKAANGFGMVYKNHSETSDFGVQVTDYAANGDYLALQVRANLQELNLLSNVGGSTAKQKVLHSGNIASYAAPTGYGLGEVYGKKCDDCLDPELKIGFYYLHSETINIPALIVNSQFGTMQVERRGDRKWHTVKFQGYVACCFLHEGVWSEWEYENPRMAVGVEYRTTERYKGSAVYKKVDTNGNILWRAENETSWHLLASADYIATATVE